MSELLLSNPYLLPVCIFVAVALGIWSLADMFVIKQDQNDERLRRIRGITANNAVLDSQSKRKEDIKQWVEKTSTVLADSVKPKTEQEASKLKQQLSYAGIRGESAQSIYLATKVVLLVAGSVIGLGGVGVFSDGSTMSWIMGASVGLILFFMPGMVIGYLGKKRKQEIILSMPDCLDLLVVCVEAGLGLDHAMRKVSEEMAESNPVLAYEVSLTNMHLQMGRTREEALQDLSDRNGAEELTSLTQMLIQADRFGTSIGQALRVQSDSLRIKRRQRAEEKASKTAVQLLFPLVLFIFPGIFVVLVGPAAINIIEGMLNN
jgi:tight adherence protein C